MFFKRLELSGFKSFGHKTVIDFQPGFTIVVGPNGCGKSNVLDGIRWVLGETSAKALRGGRMGDVVFRGTQTMKPAGLAQVTLTCNNETGRLKIDTQEVAITRRLFSNGDSEYMLNKVKCRMRDVHDLFLDTGLGADGYSVIEQGQIGQMVAAKPNERRDIFEEAAGISRYKVRREETVRKLKRTDEDLVRVFDIVNEVERQCNSLKYQARKAQRHRRLTRRVHRLQQRLIVLRHDLLSDQFNAEDIKRNDAQRNFESAAAAAAQADAAITKAQEQIDAQQRELQGLQQKRYDVRTRLDSERHRVALAVQKISGVDERIVAIDKEIESRRQRMMILSGTLDALELDLKQEQQKSSEADQELRDKVSRLDLLRRQHDIASSEMVRLRAELNELQARENTLQNDKKVAETLVARLADEMGATEFHLKELAKAIEESEKELAVHQEKARVAVEKLGALRDEARRVQDEISRDDQAKKELGARLDGLSRELGQATSRLQALRELEESYEGYFRGVKEVMVASQRGKISGVIGVVASLLSVPKDFEIAMEVALGSSMQDIVMERVEDARMARNFLLNNNLGRATFLPLDFLHSDFRTNHLDGIWNRQGVLGLGQKLVEYDPKLQKAVDYLFGNTVFVDNLDLAISMEREGIRNRFVSLQGDVVNPRGAITGGSHQTRGLLSRTREIRQLEDRVKLLEGDLTKLQEQLRATKDRLGSLYGRSAALQSDIHQCQMEEARVQKDLQSAERDRREKRNQHASIEARMTQQRMDTGRHKDVIENCEAGIVELTAKIASQQESLKAHEEGARTRSEQLQSMSEGVAVAREAQHSLNERVRAMSTRLAEARKSLEEAAGDKEAREQEKSGLLEEKEIALIEREEGEENVGNLAREFEGLDNLANDGARDLEVKSAALRQQSNEAQRLQRDRNERDNALREVQVHCAELKAQLDYLEREAEDEFALTITQIREELTAAIAADEEWRKQAEEAKIRKKEEDRQRRKEERERAAAAAGQQGELPVEGEQAITEVVDDGARLLAALEKKPASDDGDELEEAEVDVNAPPTTPEDDAVTEPGQLRAIVADLRQKLQKMGAVNEAAIEEYAQQKERMEFLSKQRDDLVDAKKQLEEAIAKIDETTTQLFNEALESIKRNFAEMFRRLFNGGVGDLILVHDEKFPEPGIDIYAQPPGKKIGGSITLMSGGEKALTAIALMFALFQFRPSPICILDEIDAPLDDVNVGRMCQALKAFASDTQFLIITHNKITMELADTIYGVTMQEPGVSKVVSVKFDEVEAAGLLDESAAG